jgi:hypothetical protein
MYILIYIYIYTLIYIYTFISVDTVVEAPSNVVIILQEMRTDGKEPLVMRIGFIYINICIYICMYIYIYT